MTGISRTDAFMSAARCQRAAARLERGYWMLIECGLDAMSEYLRT
jgi:hypothetical protein